MGERADQKKAFREAIKNLSGYYGVKDANSFMSVLLASATNKKVETVSLEDTTKKLEEGSIDDLADVLLSLSGDGIYVSEIKKRIEDYCTGDTNNDPIAKNFKGAIQEGGVAPIISLLGLDKLKSNAEADFIREGDIKSILLTDSELNDAAENRKSIGTIEVHHPNLNFSNRDTAAAAIFLQALPSIEMSKAVPYFDVKVITRGAPMTKSADADVGDVFTNGISIYRFLQGEQIDSANTTFSTLVQSTPQSFENQMPSVAGTAGGGNAPEKDEITVAGMELFTSPQTMTNGALEYFDTDTTRTTAVPYDNKIMDKFRPFMTLTGFSSNIAPSVGPLSTESASMKLKLHDKSRLKEIAPLVVPGQLGEIEIMVEYGWSHPQSNPEENPYGAIINSMRRTCKYGIVNSSYSFQPNGEVDIDLKLITKGGANAAFELISNDGANRPDHALQGTIKTIRETFQTLKGNGFALNADMGAPDVIGKTTSMKGLKSLKKEDFKKIQSFLKKMAKYSTKNKETFEGLANKINDAQKQQTELTESLKEQFKDKVLKCAAVAPTRRRVPVKTGNKSKKGNTTLTASAAAGEQTVITDPAAALESLQTSTNAALNEDFTLKNVEGNGAIKADAASNTTTAPTAKAPSAADAQTTTGTVNAVSKAKPEPKNNTTTTTAPKARYVTVDPPFAGNLSDHQTPDPYIVSRSAETSDSKGKRIHKLFSINEENYVSLAKLLLHFVAEPLSNTGKFDEVQLLFYPINEYAMWARELNVGQYPINKRRFQEVFEDQLKNSASMTIQVFLNMLSRHFFQFQGDDIYGLSSFYGKDEKGKMAVKKRYNQNETAKMKFAETKRSVLEACYPDTAIRKFKKPQIKMNVECVPHQVNKNETILRLHFFDQATDSYSSYSQMWQATSASELGTVGKYVRSVQKYRKSRPPSKKGNSKQEEKNWAELQESRRKRITDWENHFAKDYVTDEDGNISFGDIQLKPLKLEVPKEDDPEKTEPLTVYSIQGGPDQLRGILAKNMPTLKYGTEYSGILQASLATQSDPSMEIINMQRQRANDIPQGAVDDGLPLTVKPVTLSLDVFGCPFVYFGQQFFVDFQTNTTIDDIYTVTGINHSVSQKEFKTTLKLTPLNKLGQFRSMTSNLSTIAALSEEIAKIKSE